MQSRIAYHILTLLHLNGSVRIPGFGKLSLTQRTAIIDEEKHRIVPPEFIPGFEADPKSGGRRLVRYLAYQNNTSRTSARKALLRFSAALRDSLQANGSASLANLGTLSQVNDIIQFDFDSTYVQPGLPVAALPARLAGADSPVSQPKPVSPVVSAMTASSPPVTQERETIHPVVTESPVPVAPTVSARPVRQGKKRDLYWAVPIAFITLFLICLILFLVLDLPPLNNKHDMVNQSPVAMTHEPEPVNLPDKQSSDKAETETKIALADTGSRYPEDSSAHETLINRNTGPTDQTNAEVAGSDNTTVLAEAKECMVVVGAFSLTVNADRMTHLLESMDYQVKMVQHGRLSQVGVPVNCNGSDLDDIVNDLRTRVEAKAWLLRPQ